MKIILKSVFIVLFLCLLNSTSLIGQYDCATPHVITNLPYISGALTTSTGPSYQASGFCGQNTNYNEQDYIIKYTPQVDESINVMIEQNNGPEVAGIYVFTSCEQPLTECVAFEEIMDDVVDITFIGTAGQDYYIFIGTENTSIFYIEMKKEIVYGVAINKVAPTQALDVNGSIRIGEGTTTPFEGTMKYNDNKKKFEGFNGLNWESLSKTGINDLTEGFYEQDSANLILGDIDIFPNFIGKRNVFLGDYAGHYNKGNDNTYIGFLAGRSLHGSENTAIGKEAGLSFSIFGESNKNVFIGKGAGNQGGENSIGDGNVMIGWHAAYQQTGVNLSNKLFIDNNDLDSNPSYNPLIFGDFEEDYLLVNRITRINDQEIFGLSAKLSNFNLEKGMYINTTDNSAGGIPFYGFAINGVSKAKIRLSSFGSSIMSININDSNKASFYEDGDFLISGINATKSTAGSWLGNSDQRLKKNIQNLDSELILEKVLQMRGVTYEWNDEKTKFKRPKGLQIGFIAQDLQKVFPEKIKEDENGYLTAAYGTYDPVFVESIKALNNKIEKQEETIQILMKRIETMEKQLKTQTADSN